MTAVEAEAAHSRVHEQGIAMSVCLHCTEHGRKLGNLIAMFATTLNQVGNAACYTCQAVLGCGSTVHVISLTPPERHLGVMEGSYGWCYFCSCPNGGPPTAPACCISGVI